MKAIIIGNIGTPKSANPEDVKNYLKTFLMDKNILTIPWLIRYPLVNWIIAPRRAVQSAQKYQSIWTERGSPLLFHSLDLVNDMAQDLPKDIIVKLAMSYSEPTLSQVFEELSQKKITEILLVPMYPQFAQATTGSIREVANELNKKYNFRIQELKPFYQEDFFIDSFVEIIREQAKDFDHLLFSYHGLPESQMKKVSPTCLRSPDCCLQANSCEKNCYRAQSLKTTELIAKKLQLKPEQYSSSFQSRLGPVQWIKPYTDDTIVALGKKGIRKLAVVCPSFVTDCIETLEEIGIEGKHLFKENGGTEFTLLTCLNSRADWRKKFSTHLLGQCGEDKSMQRELN